MKGNKQNKKKSQKRKKNRIPYLLFLLLLTSMTLSVSSYAWFTTNRLVRIDLLNVNVQTQGGIEISSDGTNWKAILSINDIINARETYPNSINQIPSTLEPVSSVGDLEDGKMKMFYGVVENDVNDNYFLVAGRNIEEESFDEQSNGKFIAFDIFLKTSQPFQIYLTPESNITYGGENSYGIENAMRIAFVHEGTVAIGSALNTTQGLTTNQEENVYIWEPNYDIHTTHGIENAKNVYGLNITSPGQRVTYDGVSNEIAKNNKIKIQNANKISYPNYFDTVDIDLATKSNFETNEEIFYLNSGISKYRVYMWIEGQDVDCENNASVGNVSLNLQFTTNPA